MQICLKRLLWIDAIIFRTKGFIHFFGTTPFKKPLSDAAQKTHYKAGL